MFELPAVKRMPKYFIVSTLRYVDKRLVTMQSARRLSYLSRLTLNGLKIGWLA
jgi:hypothetical protein